MNYTRHMKSLIIASVAFVAIHNFRLVAAYTSLDLAIFTCLFWTSSYHVEFWLCIIEVPVSVDLVYPSGGRRLCCWDVDDTGSLNARPGRLDPMRMAWRRRLGLEAGFSSAESSTGAVFTCTANFWPLDLSLWLRAPDKGILWYGEVSSSPPMGWVNEGLLCM